VQGSKKKKASQNKKKGEEVQSRQPFVNGVNLRGGKDCKGGEKKTVENKREGTSYLNVRARRDGGKWVNGRRGKKDTGKEL